MEGIEELRLCFVCLSTYQFFVESDCQKPNKPKQKKQTKTPTSSEKICSGLKQPSLCLYPTQLDSNASISEQEEPSCFVIASIFAPCHPGRLSQPSECQDAAQQIFPCLLLSLILLLFFPLANPVAASTQSVFRKGRQSGKREWLRNVLISVIQLLMSLPAPVTVELMCLCCLLPPHICAACIYKEK